MTNEKIHIINALDFMSGGRNFKKEESIYDYQ